MAREPRMVLHSHSHLGLFFLPVSQDRYCWLWVGLMHSFHKPSLEMLIQTVLGLPIQCTPRKLDITLPDPLGHSKELCVEVPFPWACFGTGDHSVSWWGPAGSNTGAHVCWPSPGLPCTFCGVSSTLGSSAVYPRGYVASATLGKISRRCQGQEGIPGSGNNVHRPRGRSTCGDC